MNFNDSYVILLTCCSSHVAFRPFINRGRQLPSYFLTPATILLPFAARLRWFCPFLVSRGWGRNLAARCPEVGLDFCSVAIFGAKGSKPTSGHLDRSYFCWCPEVGLEFKH